MVNSNDTSQFPHIRPCPNCGVIPEPQMNEAEDEIRLRCDHCGFSSLYVETADKAIRNWEEMCDEYMQEKQRIKRQYELLSAAVREEMAR